MRLNDLTVKAFPPPGKGQKTYWDTALPGFGCRVSQGGTRSFVVMHGRSRQLITIGRYPLVSLAQARQRAKEILAERVLGKTRAGSRTSFADAVAKFLDTHDARPSTIGEYRGVLQRHFLPKLRLEPLDRIQTDDLTRIIDKLSATPSEARHAYAIASVFFNWALGRRLIDHNPLSGVKAPRPSPSRDRVLSEAELATVYRMAASAGSTIGIIVQLLIMTGQRRGEISGLRWSYIDPAEGTITWPAQTVKNGRQHTIPYGAMTAAILETVPRTGDLLFPARGRADRPFSGWSKTGLGFIRSCGIQPWTLHDLRRTFASGMQKLGVRLEVTEKYINHVSGTHAGIVGVYQRHSFMPEMREAVSRWEAKLVSLLNPETASSI